MPHHATPAGIAADALARDGYATVAAAIPAAALDAIEAQVCGLILAQAAGIGGEAGDQVQALPVDRLPHEGMIRLRDAGADHMRCTVDRLKASPAILRFLFGPDLQRLAAALLSVAPDRVALAHPNVRVDLPSRYEREERLFSLPWHQEAAYFDRMVARRTGLVFWIPLFDCGPADGCVEVLAGSHEQGLIEHASVFLEPDQRRHLRYQVSIDAPADRRPCATRRGEVGVLHFLALHRSGRNLGPTVRYTLLIRASDMFAADYCP